jgi:hypothetical protein
MKQRASKAQREGERERGREGEREREKEKERERHISSLRAATLWTPRICCTCPLLYPGISVLINCVCMYA